MTNRRTALKGSTVLMLALATGCSSSPSSSVPVSNIGAAGGAGLISNNAGGLVSNNASGLISNNAGGLISNNAGGLISNNAGGLISNNAGGLISNNAGGLISNNAGGLISNNAGGLTGTVRGPAAGLISNNAGGLISNNAGGLISNNAGGLISNNAGGLISNNAGGLISNNAGGYVILEDGAADPGDSLTEVVPNAKCAVFNERGEEISYAWTTTDENGNYTFTRLKPSGPIVFVKAVYLREGKQCVLVSTAPAPRKAGTINVTVSPATSVVAKKLGQMIQQRALSIASVHADSVDKITQEVGAVMSPKAVVAAAILSQADTATTFDNMLAESPALRASVTTTAAAESIASAVVITPANVAAAVAADAAPAPIVASDPVIAAAAAAVAANTSAPALVVPEAPGATVAAPAGAAGGTTTAPADAAPPATVTPPAGTATDPAAAPAAPAVAATDVNIKGTVSTIGSVDSSARVSMARGTNSFTAVSASGSTGGSLASLTSKLTFTDDPSNTAKAVAFDGSTAYYLVDNTIVGGGQTVTISGMGAGDTTALAVNAGTAYVCSVVLNCIVKVDLASGTTSAFAGESTNIGSFSDGQGAAAHFNSPQGLTFSGSTLFVADTYNRRIRAINAGGTVSTLAGGSLGKADGLGAAASFQSPTDITSDDRGNLYIADQNGHSIRKCAADGTVTTIAGNRAPATTDGTGLDASFFFPTSLAWGKVNGTEVLVVSQVNHKIRLVSGW